MQIARKGKTLTSNGRVQQLTAGEKVHQYLTKWEHVKHKLDRSLKPGKGSFLEKRKVTTRRVAKR